MEKRHVIRHQVLVEGRSQRSVAKTLGVDRKTVRKYVATINPRHEYKKREKPVAAVAIPMMEEILAEWSNRTTKKQRITGARLHRELRARGVSVGLTLVRDYLRSKRASTKETMIPLIWSAGDAAQVDFFEVTVDEGGRRRKAWMFVMRLMFSKRDFIRLYDHADLATVRDAHVRAFETFGYVPQRIVYDNLSPVVRRILHNQQRQLTPGFLALVGHYLFEPSFARPGTGHDKGGVEARGKGIRLSYLTPIPGGNDLDDINAQVDVLVKQETKWRSKWSTETASMLPLPAAPFEPRIAVSLSVYGNSKVRHNNAWYSVPSRWLQPEVTALIGAAEVTLKCGDEETTHRRVAPGENAIRYSHYLPELSKKPQAVRQVIGALLPELEPTFADLWRLLVDSHGPHDAARVFAKVLKAVVDHGQVAVSQALGRATSSDELMRIAGLYAHDDRVAVAVPESLSGFVVEAADVKSLSLWMTTEGGHA